MVSHRARKGHRGEIWLILIALSAIQIKNSEALRALRETNYFLMFSLRSLPVEAKRRSRYRGPVGPEDPTGMNSASPACPVAPEDGTGVAPGDGTGARDNKMDYARSAPTSPLNGS